MNQEQIYDECRSLMKEHKNFEKLKEKIEKKVKGSYLHFHPYRDIKDAELFTINETYFLPKRIEIEKGKLFIVCEKYSLFNWSSTHKIPEKTFLRYSSVKKDDIFVMSGKLLAKYSKEIQNLQDKALKDFNKIGGQE